MYKMCVDVFIDVCVGELPLLNTDQAGKADGHDHQMSPDIDFHNQDITGGLLPLPGEAKVWCGVVWCGAVRCGAVRCHAVSCVAVRCGAVRCRSSQLCCQCSPPTLMDPCYPPFAVAP